MVFDDDSSSPLFIDKQDVRFHIQIAESILSPNIVPILLLRAEISTKIPPNTRGMISARGFKCCDGEVYRISWILPPPNYSSFCVA